MLNTSFVGLLDVLKKYNVDYKDDEGNIRLHWLVKGDRVAVFKELMRRFGYSHFFQSKIYGVRKKHTCKNNLCVNPDCYELYRKGGFSGHSVVSKEDLDELVETIDLEQVEALGESNYLATYNETLPDFLKIDLTTLQQVVAYSKRKG